MFEQPPPVFLFNLRYELIYKRGDKGCRIFKTSKDLHSFLKRSPHIRCEKHEPVHISKEYRPVAESQVHCLAEQEVQNYLAEREEMGVK